MRGGGKKKQQARPQLVVAGRWGPGTAPGVFRPAGEAGVAKGGRENAALSAGYQSHVGRAVDPAAPVADLDGVAGLVPGEHADQLGDVSGGAVVDGCDDVVELEVGAVRALAVHAHHDRPL